MNTSTHHPFAVVPKRLVIATLLLVAFVVLGITLSHADVVVSAPPPVVERPETLPYTASYQPWIALLGIIALVTAGLLVSDRLLQTARSRS